MALKFKMEVKTFLSFKTHIFVFFLIKFHVASDLQRSGYTQRLISMGRLTATVWVVAWRMATSTWPSGVKRLCDGLIPRPRKKHLLRKKKKKKWDRSTRWRPTANGERNYDWPLGINDHCTDQRLSYYD
jgi:hypothetical protein